MPIIPIIRSGGSKPSGKITITENGTGIDVALYAEADVAVPASAVVSGTKSITANGTGIDVTNYAAVDVAVPSSEPQYSKVTVNVVDYRTGNNKTEVALPSATSNFINAIEVAPNGSFEVPVLKHFSFTVSGERRTRYSGFFEFNNTSAATSVTINTGNIVVSESTWATPIVNGSTDTSRRSTTKGVMFSYLEYDGSTTPVITITYGTPPAEST